MSPKEITQIRVDVATLSANMANMTSRMDRVIPFIEAGAQHRTQVLVELTEIKTEIKAYQANCDTDRNELRSAVNGVKGEVKKLELSHERQLGKNSAYAACISIFLGVANLVIDKAWGK